jgi:hypothetical protein
VDAVTGSQLDTQERDWSAWDAWATRIVARELEAERALMIDAIGCALAEERALMREEIAAAVGELRAELQVQRAAEKDVIELPAWRRRTGAA